MCVYICIHTYTSQHLLYIYIYIHTFMQVTFTVITTRILGHCGWLIRFCCTDVQVYLMDFTVLLWSCLGVLSSPDAKKIQFYFAHYFTLFYF